MKALFTLKSAINQSSVIAAVTLVSLVSVIYPEIGKANFSLQAEGQNTTALVFEIKNPAQTQTQSSLTIQNIIDSDPLPVLLSQYLKNRKSPLDVYSKNIILLPNWKKALAISFVESNMGRFCADNNCSGIGVAPETPTWRKYSTKLDWFIDLDKLLAKPIYSERFNTCRKMKGVYVQPGSEGWVNGCEKVYSELTDLEEQAAHQRLSFNTSPTLLALANFPSNGSIDIKQ